LNPSGPDHNSWHITAIVETVTVQLGPPSISLSPSLSTPEQELQVHAGSIIATLFAEEISAIYAPTIEPMPTNTPEAKPEPSVAIGEAEFFQELNTSPTLQAEPQSLTLGEFESEDMSMKDFEGYIRTNLGRDIDYRHPERLTYTERLVVKQGQRYALAKAEEQKYKRENPNKFLSDEEFDKALDDALA
jgi:hypothetical protein